MNGYLCQIVSHVPARISSNITYISTHVAPLDLLKMCNYMPLQMFVNFICRPRRQVVVLLVFQVSLVFQEIREEMA